MDILLTAISAGTILLREGLEALLVIAALAAVLKSMEESVLPLWVGGLFAVIASIGMAFVAQAFFNGAHNDLIEAGVLALSAALLFYMSGFLYVKQDARAWVASLKAKAHAASGSTYALGALAFLAVFREGAETVLFLYSLAQTSGGWGLGMVLGIVGAIGVLGMIAFMMETLVLRLPLRPMFLATSAFLFWMGFRFVGEAMQELQEQAIFSFEPVPRPEWVEWIGFAASREGIMAQFVILSIAWMLAMHHIISNRIKS